MTMQDPVPRAALPPVSISWQQLGDAIRSLGFNPRDVGHLEYKHGKLYLAPEATGPHTVITPEEPEWRSDLSTWRTKEAVDFDNLNRETGKLRETIVFLRGKLTNSRARQKVWKKRAKRAEQQRDRNARRLDAAARLTNALRTTISQQKDAVRLASNAVARDTQRRKLNLDAIAVNEANRIRMVNAEDALGDIWAQATGSTRYQPDSTHDANLNRATVLRAIAERAAATLNDNRKAPVEAAADAGLIGDHTDCRCTAVPLNAGIIGCPGCIDPDKAHKMVGSTGHIIPPARRRRPTAVVEYFPIPTCDHSKAVTVNAATGRTWCSDCGKVFVPGIDPAIALKVQQIVAGGKLP